MQPFTLDRPADIRDALRPDAEFIAGGTDMVQLMREGVRRPKRLIDLSEILPPRIATEPGMMRLGAGTTLEEVAISPAVAEACPMVAQALLETASVQVRNLATVGGNLLQRTRCGYFRDIGNPHCNKRVPGSGCAALEGENRILAVLGTSPHCIANHASDFAVTMMALDAVLLLRGPDGERRTGIGDFYRLPGEHPDIETTLRPGELVEAIEFRIDAAARNSVYLKVRDRTSFEWALISAAVGLHIENGKIAAARIAMGGVGTIPWRLPRVERALIGHAPERKAIAGAVRLASEGASGHGRNDFKITLMPRVLARAIELAGGAA